MIKKKSISILLMILAALSFHACKEAEKADIEPPSVSEGDTEPSDPKQEQTEIGEEDIRIEESLDLYGTYDQNDLLIYTLEEEYEGITLEIPQIEGLKDKQVQDKVNQDIYQRIEQAYKEIPNLRFVLYSTMANFSNVLSLNIYMSGEADDSSEQLYLNYNLVDGEPLTLEDVFTADTNLLEILYGAFREMLITEQMQGNYDENRLYKIVKSYTSAEDKDFSFTPSGIFFYYKGQTASVKMLDIAQQVSIYSKFLTEETLYERDDIGKKNVFTGVNIPEDLFEIWEYGYLEENLWYDYVVLKEYFWNETEEMHMEEYLQFKERIYDEIALEIESYQKQAKANPDSFYILLVKPEIVMETDSQWMGDSWKETYTGNAFVNNRFQLFEMPRDMQNEIYRNEIIEAYRYDYLAMQGGVELELTQENVSCDMVKEELYYNYLTGESLTRE